MEGPLIIAKIRIMWSRRRKEDCQSRLYMDWTRPQNRRISRRTERLFGLAAGKIAASRQPGRKINAAKPPPNVWLKAALPRDVNEKLTSTVQGSYDQAR